MRVLQIVADGNPGGGTTHVLQILRGFRSTHSMGLVTQSQSYLFHQAKELDIPYMVIYGQREVLDKTVIVRTVKSNSQENVKIEKLAEYLKKLK